jgi:hypothetical protein
MNNYIWHKGYPEIGEDVIIVKFSPPISNLFKVRFDYFLAYRNYISDESNEVVWYTSYDDEIIDDDRIIMWTELPTTGFTEEELKYFTVDSSYYNSIPVNNMLKRQKESQATVKIGKWIYDEEDKWWKCSNCAQYADVLYIDYMNNLTTPHKSEYCSCCGAKMEVS